MRRIFIVFCGILAIHAAFVARANADEYLDYAQNLDASIRNLAAEEAKLKFNLIAIQEFRYLNSAVLEINSLLKELESVAQEFSESLDQLGKTSDRVDPNSLKELISQLAIAQVQFDSAKRISGEIYRLLDATDREKEFFADFCPKNANKVDVAQLRAQPYNYPISSQMNYTKYGTVLHAGNHPEGDSGAFTDDPVVDGAAIFVVGVTFTAAIVYLICTQGLAAVLSGSGPAVAVSGPAAGIVLCVVAVVIVLATAWTDHRNVERRRQAEHKYHEQIDRFNGARDWFHKNKLDQAQYAMLATETCKSQEFSQKIERKKIEFGTLLEGIALARRQLNDQSAALDSGMASVNQYYENYKSALASSLSKDLIFAVEREVKGEVIRMAIWRFYNEEIKSRLSNANLQINKSASCTDKSLLLSEVKLQIGVTQMLIESFQETGQEPRATSEVASRIAKAMAILESKLLPCNIQEASRIDMYEF